MINASIVSTYGVFTWHIWEGQLLPLSFVADVYQRLGQIGSGVQLLGGMAPPSPITAHMLLADMTTAVTVKNSVSLLVGSFVSVNEPNGTAWTNVLVRQAVARYANGKYTFGGTTYPVRVTAQFVFETQQ